MRIEAHMIAWAVALAVVPLGTAQNILFVNHLAEPGGDGQAWSSAYRDLFEALDDAARDPSVDQIWVAAGTYTPDRGGGDRDQTFELVAGVAIFGGFVGSETELDERDPETNETVLSGDFGSNDGPGFTNIADNARHVISAADLVQPAILDSLTVRGGNADFPGEDLIGGGGLFILNSPVEVNDCRFVANSAGRDMPELGGFGGAAFLDVGSLTIRRCRFVANRGNDGGALGIFEGLLTVDDTVFDQNAAPHQVGGVMWAADETDINYRNCQFTGNFAQYAGALFTVLSTHVEIVGCTFRQNTALVLAGACWFQRSDVNDTVVTIIDRCAFIDNTTGSRGALFLEENDTLLTNSVFFGNRAIHPSGNSGGGVFTLFDDLEVVNCLFSGNSAQSGGGITAHRSDVFKVTNSTLSGNRALFANSGGGILVSVTVLELTNSVLFGNRSGAQTNETAQVTGIVVPNFNTIQNWTGGLGGVGNHGLDPMFIDADGPDDVIGTEDDDLRLQAGSPAIDAADSTAVPAGIEVDLDGLARFVDDPGTEDTGSGKPPIVDMGAFEFQGIDCPADLDGNGIVGVGDLLALLSAWGPCQACPEDINGDGVVGVADLLAVLSAWGPCP